MSYVVTSIVRHLITVTYYGIFEDWETRIQIIDLVVIDEETQDEVYYRVGIYSMVGVLSKP